MWISIPHAKWHREALRWENVSHFLRNCPVLFGTVQRLRAAGEIGLGSPLGKPESVFKRYEVCWKLMLGRQGCDGRSVAKRRFWFAATGGLVSPVAVKRRILRGFLIVALVFSAGFAAWGWFRPYAWNQDSAARSKVVGCQVRQDRDHFWVDMHLKVLSGQTHDLMKPVRLVTASGREIEPADTTLGGMDGGGTSEIWLKFWLEPGEINGPLTLRINDGSLVIRANSGAPSLGVSKIEYFTTNHW